MKATTTSCKSSPDDKDRDSYSYSSRGKRFSERFVMVLISSDCHSGFGHLMPSLYSFIDLNQYKQIFK